MMEEVYLYDQVNCEHENIEEIHATKTKKYSCIQHDVVFHGLCVDINMI